MSEKLILPGDLQSPDEAAAQWLILRDRGFQVGEAAAFEVWLAQSEANADAWAQADDLWGSFDEPPDMLLEQIRKSALAARPSPAPRLLIAASIAALAMLSGVAGWIALRPPSGLESALAFAGDPRHPDYATAIGAPSTVELADGSHVTLDTNSALSVRLTPGRRDVRLLRGRAYFDVAPDVKRPFTVEAGSRAVTALGTAFSVRWESQAVSVVLERGHVRIAAPHRADVALAPGQAFEAQDDSAGRIESVDVGRDLAWRSGYLEFRDEPLTQAVGEMSRYGGGQVTFGDARAAGLKITGRFRIGDPVRFAHVLTDVYPLRVTERPGGATISAR
jgi:transmembrane sensor